MPLKKLQNQIIEFIDSADESGLQLYFVMKEGDDFALYEPAIEHKLLEPTLKNNFLQEMELEFLAGEDSELEVVNLNTAEGTDRRTIYQIKLNEIPKAKRLFDIVKSDENIDSYKPSEHDISDIWAFVIKIATAEKEIFLFKKNYNVNVIRADKGYTLFFEKGALQLERKELLKLSSKFDFVLLENELYIQAKDRFEVWFDYAEAMEGKANVAIDLLLDTGLVLDASIIYDLSKKRGDLKKIINISKENPVFKKTPKQLANFAKKYGHPLTLSADGNHIDLKNQKEARSLIKIFNDDFLLSELSKRKYDSRGKLKLDVE